MSNDTKKRKRDCVNNSNNRRYKRRRHNKSKRYSESPSKKDTHNFVDSYSLIIKINNDTDNNNNNDNNNKCLNFDCDHNIDSDVINMITIRDNFRIENINDLIYLGKKYHCKQNKLYGQLHLKNLFSIITPLTKLNNLIGLQNIKEQLLENILYLLQNLNETKKNNKFNEELSENKDMDNYKYVKNTRKDMMHVIITGPPGVGKTELGKIIGEIYKNLGILADGHLHVAKRSDLVGEFLGSTAIKTQEFIDKCKGGVMFIDEAYSLGSKNNKDNFSKECIDTLNQNLSENQNFLCIIAGYADSLNENFFSMNEGLRSRFPFIYEINKYTASELTQMFLQKIQFNNWYTNVEQELLLELFNNNYVYFKYYGRDIDHLFLKCKIAHARNNVLLLNPNNMLTYDDIVSGFKKIISVVKIVDDLNKISGNARLMYS